jgi:hypothetical protein
LTRPSGDRWGELFLTPAKTFREGDSHKAESPADRKASLR